MHTDSRVISQAPDPINGTLPIPTRTLTAQQDDQAGVALQPVPLAGQGLDNVEDQQEDIIPLLAQPAPHSVQHHQVPSYIKGVQPEAREEAGGDHQLPSPPAKPTSPKMIFSELYKSPKSPFSKLRSSHPQPVALPPDLDADLISKDKTRQKEAVKKYLAEKIRNDWDFTWPPTQSAEPFVAASSSDRPDVATASGEPSAVIQPLSEAIRTLPIEDEAPRDAGEEADSESDAESVYSTVSEDPEHFRPRAEWTSDLSDDDEPRSGASPFRFDSPDAVGTAITTSNLEKQARRRRAVRDEIKWNPGLACFEARRDAWTGARMVRVKPKPPAPASPSSSRRLFWRHHRSESATSSHGGLVVGSPPAVSSPLSPTTTRTSQQTDGSTGSPPQSDQDSSHSIPKAQDTPHELYAIETLLPVAPPLLPPQNPMRASVTPSIYPSLYDKIIVHNLQPTCPVNLSDMIRACVVGWKRDGEWPPRPTMAAPVLTATDLAAIRQRKAEAARQQHARKASTVTNGSSRRLSFGFLGGHKEDKEGKDKETKEAKDNGSDEGTGKAFRRSLQKVFSLGHGHSHSVNGPSTPTSPAVAVGDVHKEVTAAT
ncbi:hypothetical protein QBC47DRAFT_215850 [Echria macrotheca]|uniref:Gag1-like clamp domain-containing protein n=1 Tax=Echria macrotheca TaxID=438768 RepID=A0AAJ0BA80_9PEZI|nr:hypothetical protein QBC47DRAFT_215850 [Echria macrotheca]